MGPDAVILGAKKLGDDGQQDYAFQYNQKVGQAHYADILSEFLVRGKHLINYSKLYGIKKNKKTGGEVVFFTE